MAENSDIRIVDEVGFMEKTFCGPRCPVHNTYTRYISTTNPYRYKCNDCDERYDRNFNKMSDDINWAVK